MSRQNELLANIAPKDPDKCFCPRCHPNGAIHPPFIPGKWDSKTALRNLGMVQRRRIDNNPFLQWRAEEGSINGCSWKDEKTGAVCVYVHPDCPCPIRTFAHEIAHHLFGHTDKLEHKLTEEQTRADERDVEAVAMLVCDALGLGEETLECSRSYLAIYCDGIPEDRWDAIKDTAVIILEAGKPQEVRNV